MHYILWYISWEEGQEMELLINLSVPIGRGCICDLPCAYGGSVCDRLGPGRARTPV